MNNLFVIRQRVFINLLKSIIGHQSIVLQLFLDSERIVGFINDDCFNFSAHNIFTFRCASAIILRSYTRNTFRRNDVNETAIENPLSLATFHWRFKRFDEVLRRI